MTQLQRSAPLRIAMWSGPRNISTAMMRAFENRGDCAVVDEPFYAHYLAATGLDHPGREEVIAAGETDWRKVAAALTGPVPDAQPVCYQKHMTHHMLPQIGHDWFGAVAHVFLIRHPRRVLASYIKSRPQAQPIAADIGVPQQAALYDEIAQRCGRAAPVIDADAFLKNPEIHLRALCTLLQMPYTDRMLHWPAGARVSDGVWAPYWYDAVRKSTGFEPWCERDKSVPPQYDEIVASCLPTYERLRSRSLSPAAAT
ncbi:MAG TPA: hypothetical protein VIE67_02105 [Rudaea sp.]|jgi:hypothetical protein|uniref:sulfotransferase-like domain-containing protein n=1 Tax=Rudaea sp. TaxID=2136325 RepID=UPI002F957877